MNLLRRLGAWWRGRCRRIDRDLLFPEIRCPGWPRPLQATTAAIATYIAASWAWSRFEEWENEPVDFVFDQDRAANVALVLKKRERIEAARRAGVGLPEDL